MKNKILYYIYKYILSIPFLIYYRPKFVNKHYIPKNGPIIICGNHKHLYDQCLPIIATNRMLHYMAKKEYFDNKKVAWFFKSSGCISVDRQNKEEAHKAMEEAIRLLKENEAIGIFPEGTRNKTNDLLLPFKMGTVKMAKETNATIVPFAITGEYKFLRNKLTITFLKPFKVKDMDLVEANEKLRNIILKQIKNTK